MHFGFASVSDNVANKHVLLKQIFYANSDASFVRYLSTTFDCPFESDNLFLCVSFVVLHFLHCTDLKLE